LRAKGYKTYNNKLPIDAWNYLDPVTLRNRLQDFIQKADDINFGVGLEHVNRYVKSGATYLLSKLES